MPRGRILRGRCPMGSGIMMLDLVDLESESVTSVPCEAGPTVRALNDAFSSKGKNPVGEIIDYDVDERGVMTQFWPAGGMEKNGPSGVASPERAGEEDPGTRPSGEDM